MRLKSIIAAAGFVAALAALGASTAQAQAKPTYEKAGDLMPVCANCHEQSHATTMLTAHGANNDAAGSACQACHAGFRVQNPATGAYDMKPGIIKEKAADGRSKTAGGGQ